MKVTKVLLGVCFIILLIASLCWPALAQSWEITGPGRGNITFYLASNTLTLINGYHPAQLCLAGDWAVCGYVVGNTLYRDPYASFVYSSSADGGTVHWASNTPSAYTCSLLLGYAFTGNGAQTYDSWHYAISPPPRSNYTYVYDGSCNGTLVARYYTQLPNYSYNCQSWAVSHVYALTAPAVPEPSSVLALLSGLVMLGGFSKRRRH